MASQSERQPLQRLLNKALRAPNCVHSQDGGAVLALAIHCLFVQAGFSNVQAPRPNDYTPQPDWNCSHEAWGFQYQKKGYANVFTYECGLKRSTGQAYVHVTEDRNENNVSFMGLILQKYIPNAASLRQDTWEGVLANEVDLVNYFDNYIMQPVLFKALPGSSDPQDDHNPSRKSILSAAGLASLLCVVIWSVIRKRQSNSQTH